MRVIGFNFTKISIEKTKEPAEVIEKLNTKTKIDVPEIKEIKSHLLKTKDELLGVSFAYQVTYEPEVAKINLEGKILFSADAKAVKEILKQWKKKSMPEEFRLLIFNIILKKSTLKALHLEEELNLPLHMPMPSFKKEEKEK